MSSVLRTLLVPALLLVSSAAPSARVVEFVDVTRGAGIRWGFRALAPGALYLVETMGGGGGFIDYDSGGDLDIYLVCYTQTPQPDPAARRPKLTNWKSAGRAGRRARLKIERRPVRLRH